MDKVIRTVVASEHDNKHVIDVYYEGSAERISFGKTEISNEWVVQLEDARKRNDLVWIVALLDLLSSITELKHEAK